MVKLYYGISRLSILLAAIALCAFTAEANEGSTRTIHLRQNDAQVRFESKIYELKNAKAEEILPFVNSAILRYDANSTIRRVTTENGNNNAQKYLEKLKK